MNNFDFCSPTRILFGKNTQKEIGKLIKPYAKKILLHYGNSSIKQNGLYEEVINSIKTHEIDFVELGGVVPNPRLDLVHEGIKLCQKENIELILAVGGGSVIDSAKAIAMGFYYEGNIWNVYETKEEVKKALPVACILTIPAAGSEVSCHTVITNEEKKSKYGYGSQILKPILSIINPEIFFTIPKKQIANGVSDMISHVFERYFTNTEHTDLTDGLCESVVKTIMKNALIVIDDPNNYEAWCEIGFSAMIAHNDLLGMGREEDWACHAMEHELSAKYDIAHGAGLAILTPNWMEYTCSEKPNIFAQFSINMMGVNENRNQNAVIREGIKRLREFYIKMNLPKTLNDVEIDQTNLEIMAKKAVNFESKKNQTIGFFKKLHWENIYEIYKKSLNE
ncbi:MAG: iron-containing alcohol dehydrogenase [Clostridiales bacterium]|jgi:alcohol dehydrogenase YqhD (iron-dependent ADH family)|nr:iron-containing alcohol dehydrogenase [Clostridiales bacterium]